MIKEVIQKCEEICNSKEYNIYISYEYDGAYSAKIKIRKEGEEKSLGKIFFDYENNVFTYKKYDNTNSDVVFLNWSIISNLRLRDKIEIIEPLKKKNHIKSFSIGVRKLCEKADFVNLKNQGYGLQILLKKENADCQTMKFNLAKKRYEPVKE